MKESANARNVKIVTRFLEIGKYFALQGVE
jgi:hypothetical protein